MIKRILFSIGAIGFLIGGASSLAHAENFQQSEEPIIKPPVEEQKLREAKIDTESLEIGPYYGLYALDGFGTSSVYGIRLAYHLTEDVFFEGTYGITRFNQDTFRNLTGRSLVTDEKITYWNAGAGYNLLPGQTFLTRKKTLNSTIYLLGGLGQTQIDGQAHFTFDAGTGYKIYIVDWFEFRMELRAHILQADITGENKVMKNIEGTAAFAVFF
jgi:outer membrane beta-barrel protein